MHCPAIHDATALKDDEKITPMCADESDPSNTGNYGKNANFWWFRYTV